MTPFIIEEFIQAVQDGSNIAKPNNEASHCELNKLNLNEILEMAMQFYFQRIT